MNNVSDILSTWIALEVLSPQTFYSPKDLAGGKEASIARFTFNQLPWEGEGEKPKPNK